MILARNCDVSVKRQWHEKREKERERERERRIWTLNNTSRRTEKENLICIHAPRSLVLVFFLLAPLFLPLLFILPLLYSIILMRFIPQMYLCLFALSLSPQLVFICPLGLLCSILSSPSIHQLCIFAAVWIFLQHRAQKTARDPR